MTPEGSLLRTVGDLLSAERIWWMRCNTGCIPVGDGESRRYFTAGRKGMADILALPTQRYCPGCGARPAKPWAAGSQKSGCCARSMDSAVVPLWLELKSGRGKQSLHQHEFQHEVEGEEHVYLLVRDVREVEAWLKANR